MNPEIKQLWLESLRSGEYAQTTGALQNLRDGKSSFCCLGVLCDLAEKAGVTSHEIEYSEADSNGYGIYQDGDGFTYTAMLPKVVVDWAELESREIFDASDVPNTNGQLKNRVTVDDVSYFALWELNDKAKLTFEQIADIIEEQF